MKNSGNDEAERGNASLGSGDEGVGGDSPMENSSVAGEVPEEDVSVMDEDGLETKTSNQQKGGDEVGGEDTPRQNSNDGDADEDVNTKTTNQGVGGLPDQSNANQGVGDVDTAMENNNLVDDILDHLENRSQDFFAQSPESMNAEEETFLQYAGDPYVYFDKKRMYSTRVRGRSLLGLHHSATRLQDNYSTSPLPQVCEPALFNHVLHF
jgi:hypothetical protein